MNDEKQKYIKFEILIAKIYLYLLPIRMFNIFSTLTIYLKDIAKYIDFLVCILGLFFLVIRKAIVRKKTSTLKKDKLFSFLVFMIIVFNITSILMASVFDYKYGAYAGESPYIAVFKMILIFLQYILMILYNKEIFKMLGVNKIKTILSRTVIFLLIVGYAQLFVLVGINPILVIYNKIDILDIFVDSVSTMKLPITESEGALAGGLISIFILPFLAANILSEKNNGKYIFQMILWVPLIIFSGSLTEYLLFCVFLITFIFYLFKTKKVKIKLHTIIILPVILVVCAFVLWNKLPDNITQNIIYTITDKITDTNNGSTVSRTIIPMKYNMGAFKEYPLLGVGNGNQGYFYYDYVDYKYSLVPGVKASYDNASNTIYNGGLFFPSILSGYGIIGTILLIVYILKSEKELNMHEKNLDIFYYYYKVARIPFLLAGFQTLFVGVYYIWFVMSIPHFNCD